MARSNNREIQAIRFTDRGPISVPPLLVLAQRQFEKDPPIKGAATDATLTVPIDLLRTLKVTPYLLNDIESIEVVYRKRS